MMSAAFRSPTLLMLAILCLMAAVSTLRAQPAAMPEFPDAPPDRWLNSKPLKLSDVRGQVVLIEIWTST